MLVLCRRAEPSEGLALRVQRGAAGAVALQGGGVVVQGGDVGQAAGQPGAQEANVAVGAHAVVPVDERGLQDGPLWAEFRKEQPGLNYITHGGCKHMKACQKNDN